jgi:zinc/manganese transport system permease protein
LVSGLLAGSPRCRGRRGTGARCCSPDRASAPSAGGAHRHPRLASTAQILFLANDLHGGEDLKDLLAGQILWVTPQQLLHAAILTAVFLLAWFRFRPQLGRVGFYVMFALVVTISVQLVGVYLVFTSLIVPAVATYRYPQRRQLALGYGLALVSYVVGLVLSAVIDLPSSPVIVWAMALIGLLVHFGGRQTPPPASH